MATRRSRTTRESKYVVSFVKADNGEILDVTVKAGSEKIAITEAIREMSDEVVASDYFAFKISKKGSEEASEIVASAYTFKDENGESVVVKGKILPPLRYSEDEG